MLLYFFSCRVLGPHGVLGPPKVLGPPRVLDPHRVLGPRSSQGLGSRFCGMPSMVAGERISNENSVYFILLSIPRANQSVKKVFLNVECYCFHKFCKTNSLQDGVKTFAED